MPGGYVVQQGEFSGPLDVLLQLIEKHELEITEVSLSEVADEFLAYAETHDDIPANEVADFLVVASRLLYLKSRAILPSAIMPEEEEAQDLASQLKMYKTFVEASGWIGQRINEGQVAYGREQIVVEKDAGFYPPEKLGAGDLQSSFERVLGRLKPFFKLAQKTMQRVVSIKEKISSIRTYVSKITTGSFRELVQKAETRSEVVVSFLAMLELVKQRELHTAQDDLFGDIKLTKTK